MLRQLLNGQPLDENQRLLPEISPRTSLKEEQKALNQKRKQINKERNLRKKIDDAKQKYKDWEKARKKLMKDEKERYEQELSRLERELRKATEEEDEDEMQEAPKENTIEMEHHQRTLAAMENRALQAERLAWESQQAVLTMQSQFQQMVAFQHAAAANAPGAAPVPSAEPWVPASPALGRANGTEAHSPQMPKVGVQKPQLKQNTQPRVPKHIPKEQKEAAITVKDDDDEDEDDKDKPSGI